MIKAHARLDWKISPAYAVASGNYATLHYQDGTHVLISYTMKAIQERFVGLFRIRKGVAIRLDYIDRYEHDPPGKQMTIWLRDGRAVEVSRRRYEDVRRVLMETARGVAQ